MKAVRLVLALTALHAGTVQADEVSRQLPASLRADRIVIDQKTGISRYQGHVVVNQGTLRLTADQATVEQQGQLLRRVTATGHPVTFRDKPEGQIQFIDGESQRAEYEALEQKLHLIDKVVVRQGDDLIRAGEIHYHLNTETIRARSLDGQRVVATLNPARKSGSEETKP